MPRKNRNANPEKLKRHIVGSAEKNKKRYPTEKAALDAAEYLMLLHPDIKLRTYQGVDLGWYLTSD